MAEILVVDDDPIVRELVLLWLRTAGYRCDAVPDAQSAWSYVRQHQVRLMLLDVLMPGESGIDLLRRLRGQFPGIQVSMMTSVNDESTALEALSLGAFAYLTKPVELDDLLAHVNHGIQLAAMTSEGGLRSGAAGVPQDHAPVATPVPPRQESWLAALCSPPSGP